MKTMCQRFLLSAVSIMLHTPLKCIGILFPVQLRDGRVFTVADAFVLPGEEQLYQCAAQDHAVRENGDGLCLVHCQAQDVICIFSDERQIISGFFGR